MKELMNYYMDGKMIVRKEVMWRKEVNVEVKCGVENKLFEDVELYVEVLLMEYKGNRKEIYVVEINGVKYLSRSFKVKGKKVIKFELN